MKKHYVLLALLILFTGTVFAQGLDLNIFMSAVFDTDNTNGFEGVLIKSRNGVGIAYDHEVMPFVSPGVEVQIGFCPFGTMLKEKVIMFDYSARIYNGMRILAFELQPYIGYNFRTANADGIAYNSGMAELGIRGIFSSYGLEFGMIFPANEIVIPAFGQFRDSLVVVIAKPSAKLSLTWHLRRR